MESKTEMLRLSDVRRTWMIRPARVAVAEPEPGGSAAGDSSDEDAKGDGDSED